MSIDLGGEIPVVEGSGRAVCLRCHVHGGLPRGHSCRCPPEDYPARARPSHRSRNSIETLPVHGLLSSLEPSSRSSPSRPSRLLSHINGYADVN